MMEMMVAIMIVGLMASLILPTLGTMLAENRQHSAAIDVMLAARHARMEAMFSGYASALHYSEQPGGAVIAPVTGITTRCNRGDGVQYAHSETPAALPMGWQELGGAAAIFIRRYDLGGRAIRTRLTFNNAAVNTAFLCWEPRGECWYSNDPWSAGAVNPQTVMFFERFDTDGNQVGTARQLVFAASCTPRLR